MAQPAIFGGPGSRLHVAGRVDGKHVLDGELAQFGGARRGGCHGGRLPLFEDGLPGVVVARRLLDAVRIVEAAGVLQG